MRRALFEQLGGFDERFFMYLEDTDLSLRAALAGFACRFAPESVVYHHYAVRVGAAKTFHLERNRYLMLLKCYQTTTLLLILPALALVEAVTWGFALLSGPAHLTAKLRAIGWLARHLPAVLAARRQVQATRQVSDQALLQRFDSPLAFEQMLSGPRLRLARALCDRPLALWRRALLAAAD
jgi:GT2 family glycosyltransferase